MSETAQIFFNRDASFQDLLRDLAGSVAGLLFMASKDKFITGKFKTAFGILALSLVIISSFTLLRTILILQFRNSSVPILFTFDHWWEQYFFNANEAESEITNCPEFSSDLKNNSIKVSFSKGEYPGISFNEVYPDWHKFKKLRFSIFSQHNDTIGLCIRVNDLYHNNDYYDRYNGNFMVTPGKNQIEIAIFDIENSLKNRKMDLLKINKMVIFIIKPQVPITLFFDDFKLSI